MSTKSHLGRRGFLGIGAAAVATAGLAPRVASRWVRGSRPSARFSETHAYPDAPTTVVVKASGVVDGRRARSAELIVETPSGDRFSRPLALPEFEGGETTIDVVLAYPFDERVPGDYRYTVRVDVDGDLIETAEAAGYNVRRIVFFS